MDLQVSQHIHGRLFVLSPSPKIIFLSPLSNRLRAEYMCVHAGGVFALTGPQKTGSKAKVVKPSQRRASLRKAAVTPSDGPTRRFFDGDALRPPSVTQ